MATLIPKPKSSSCSQNVLKNKLRFFLILLAIAAIVCAAVSIGLLYKKCKSLQREINRVKLYKLHQHQADGSRISKLEVALANNEAKLFNQGELIKRLGLNLEHQSRQPDIKAMNIIKELEAHRDMYIQSEQKNDAYEQRLLALSQELIFYKDQNQLIRQEQARMRHEYQELLNKLSKKIPPQENLQKDLELKLSQFVNTDYEHEEKLKELQKAVESCVKVGELKALEVYYDDKINSLSHTVQNLPVKNSLESQNPQKLNTKSEEMKIADNKLDEHQNKEKLQLIEKPVQSIGGQHKEAIRNSNMLSQRKSESKEVQTNLTELNRQTNQQAECVHHNISQSQQLKSQNFQKEQKRNDFENNPNEYERYFESDLLRLVNAFVNLLDDM